MNKLSKLEEILKTVIDPSTEHPIAEGDRIINIELKQSNTAPEGEEST